MIEALSRQYGVAVIMPDAFLSSYADMAHGLKYQTYLSEELPDIMRGFFPLSDRRADNFLLGCSMGGYGAFRIGLSHPESYSAIGSLSSGIAASRRSSAAATTADSPSPTQSSPPPVPIPPTMKRKAARVRLQMPEPLRKFSSASENRIRIRWRIAVRRAISSPRCRLNSIMRKPKAGTAGRSGMRSWTRFFSSAG